MRIKLTERLFMEQCIHAPWCWDLYQLQTGVRKGVEIEIEKPIGVFGLPFETAIKVLADCQLESEGKEMEVAEYIEAFKQIQKEAIQNIKESIKTIKQLNEDGNI